MSKHLVEYVWLDGYTPEPTLRSKVKVVEKDDAQPDAFMQRPDDLTLRNIPDWGFDGSSTKQAAGNDSDCLLKPVRLYKSPLQDVQYFVMCEVLNADGTPHESNTRRTLTDTLINANTDGDEWWFGFEQEFFFTKDSRPLGWPKDEFPGEQGPYYCGVGHGKVTGRMIANMHARACLIAGIDITGTNAEVALGQWEYQCFGKSAVKAADDLWMSRYILQRIAEEANLAIDFSPKPIKGDWNGSGMHANFSNDTMRDSGGKAHMEEICTKLGANHSAHIEVYGSKNDERLTGEHETQKIDSFSYGVSDRGASIRIPVATVKNDWKGYLEDRRPAANADSYRVVSALIATLSAKST